MKRANEKLLLPGVQRAVCVKRKERLTKRGTSEAIYGESGKHTAKRSKEFLQKV